MHTRKRLKLKTMMEGKVFYLKFKDSFGSDRSIPINNDGIILEPDDVFYDAILTEAKKYTPLKLIVIEEINEISNEKEEIQVPFAGKVIDDAKKSSDEAHTQQKQTQQKRKLQSKSDESKKENSLTNKKRLNK